MLQLVYVNRVGFAVTSRFVFLLQQEYLLCNTLK